MSETPKALPVPKNADGAPRKVGVEIEFGALAEERVTGIVEDVLGGTRSERGEKGYVIEDTEIGPVEVYLDTQYLKRAETALEQRVHDLARMVVPVEIVTAPIEPADIARIDELCDALAGAGATGTASGIFLGFGVHFNPEVVDLSLDNILPVLRSYAFLEDAFRDAMGIDLARRMLPFVDPYPRPLLDALAGEVESLEHLIDIYLDRAPSRNHGLDMLCLFAEIDQDRVAKAMDLNLVSARPTYHFRLPDARLDEDGWSLGLEWNRWVRVEEVAQDADLVAELCNAWRDHRGRLITTRGDWTKRSAEIVGGFV
ncbi:Putative amidoligase enzyme [Roseivivax halotolerans]|uniref:Amidoligase enzyme n=1 Tax=Roseivivax halotolerans TaxID=93684 RepID=A0A1I6A087_9RHOB|nr:amidoligase family protein [Roseivivax halotolerans]SFQ62085.1 Putative amidoligase enzyme [Roseivivax halotolerans]